jgi:hypothetical protein
MISIWYANYNLDAYFSRMAMHNVEVAMDGVLFAQGQKRGEKKG